MSKTESMEITSITIDKEFESLIPPLTADEFKQLEENCVKEGIRDAFITWNGILIDGHNRYRIAIKHNLGWTCKEKAFADRDEAIAWICSNQLGRRNLHVLDREALMNKKREALARRARKRQATSTGGAKPQLRENLPQADTGRVRDIIGKELGVSGRQVDKLHEINKKATPQTKQLVREGKLSINQAFNAVHPKRPDPVKQAKKEHEAFQEQKQKSVVSFRDAQIDKINQRIIDNSTYQGILKVIGNVEGFGLLHKREEIEKVVTGLSLDERNNLKERCSVCKSVFQLIIDTTMR